MYIVTVLNSKASLTKIRPIGQYNDHIHIPICLDQRKKNLKKSFLILLAKSVLGI